jgi:hypothetical protein
VAAVDPNAGAGGAGGAGGAKSMRRVRARACAPQQRIVRINNGSREGVLRSEPVLDTGDAEAPDQERRLIRKCGASFMGGGLYRRANLEHRLS